jgi:putative transcriptional regulator
MIECRLRVILADRYMTITDLHRGTNLSRTTLTNLYFNRGKGIDFETVDLICQYLKIEISDLFEIKEKAE